MTSLLTNVAASEALRTLTTTQRALAKTQDQISSGLRVGSAQDGAAVWAIGVAMKSNIGELSAVNAGLDLTSSELAVTKSALDLIYSNLDGINQDLVNAQQQGVDKTTIQKDIFARQTAIGDAALNATFNGVNLITDFFDEVVQGNGSLKISDQYENSGAMDNSGRATTTGTNANLSFVVPAGVDGISITLNGFNVVSDYTYTSGNTSSSSIETAGRNYGGDNNEGILTANTALTINPMSYTKLGRPGLGNQPTSILDFTIDGIASPDVGGGTQPVVASNQDLVIIQKSVETALASLTSVSATIGAFQNRVEGLKTFNTVLSDRLTEGVGSLVDADMNVTSTRLQALQTQQQLGLRSLSIANSDSLLILKLFA